MNYDVIIIGAGLGGLTAGAKLAKEGKKILLIEQHDIPGGCATSFMRKQYTMEVGLHEMDGLHARDLKTKIFNDLGVFDRVKFLRVPEFYRFYNTRHDIVIAHDPGEAINTLLKSFPDEEEGIRTYFEHVLNARRIMVESKNVEDKSLGDFLDEIISDEDLKLVLLGNLGYFHDDPYTLSYYYYLNAQGSYYAGGANFVKGGSQKLSDALADIIRSNGGEIRLKHEVTGIIFEEDRPVGVSYSKTRGSDEIYSDRASEIIVNSSLPLLAENLLPEDWGRELAGAISDLDIGASLLTVYYGFRKDLKSLGNKYYSTFIFDESVKNQADIAGNNHAGFDRRSFTFVDYSQLDSGLAPEGKGVGAACCIDYPEDWENLGAKEYKIQKKRTEEMITARLDNLIPGFRQAVAHAEVATALTVKKYTLNKKGAVYGFAQKPGKSNKYLSVLPGNMHIASAWGKFGGGFSGAIYSGYMTALGVLRKG
ncbi:MAG: NAD(P)/FAD-dependent oxidoreductase [Bacteroidales bacterium]|nr:NAD(P)/FAD-dependent oxidoreductase [Bacteroidales bacterium]